MGAIRSYRDLIAWQKGMQAAAGAYRWAAALPAYERYALARQARRCSTSVPLNIAEGYGTGTTRQFLRHLRTARGSLCELETALELGRILHQVQPAPELLTHVAETGRVLQGLIESLERKDSGASDGDAE
ncbi:MAG TPA: four helix bundle protein [Phycisphaerales bacterium]|nr:four helix bundle protein [Phycisphaerales bacterium]